MIKAYDRYGNSLETPEVIEIQWNRKYFEAGNFTLYTSAKHFDFNIKYIQMEGKPETGIVQKILYEEKPEGEFISLSGFFIEKLLEWGSVTKDYMFKFSNGTADSAKDAIGKLLYAAFEQHTDNLKNSISSPSSITLEPYRLPVFYETTLDNKSVWGDSLGDCIIFPAENVEECIRDILKNDNRGLLITPTFNPSHNAEEPLLGLKLNTYKGRELQNDVYFGKAWNNVSKIEYVTDDSANKNNIVGIQTLPEDCSYSGMKQIWHDSRWQKVIFEYYRYRKNMPSNMGNCNPIKVIFTNANNVTEGKEASVRRQMQQQLKLEMLNNYKVQTVSVDVIQNNFIYQKDYDLGDVCTVSVDEMEVQFNARIVEVHEVYARNKLSVQLVLGTPNQKEYRRVII